MTKRAWQSFIPFFAVIILVVAFSYFQERRLSKRVHDQVAATLEHTLATTRTAALAWKQRHITQVANIARHPTLLDEVKPLLPLHERSELLTSDTLVKLRSHMAQTLANYGYLGFFIIAPDGTSLASMRNSNLGSQNLLKTQAPELFAQALAGNVVISPPLHTDVPVVGAGGRLSKAAPTMFSLAPIRDRDGNIIAVFTLRMNPLSEFTTLFSLGRRGQTGETYAFNKDEMLISESRFIDTLHLAGLLKSGEASTLNIPVHNPGFNPFDGTRDVDMDASPPTFAAASALAGERGENLEGYLNYLGREVVGAWLWDAELGFGIATEISKDEAFGALQTTIVTTRTFAGCTIVLLLVLAYVQHRNRRQLQAQELETLNALDRAEQANQSKMVFLSSMSHELRTPLNAVTGFSQLLLDEESVRKNPLHTEQIQNILRSGEHLSKLVDEILEFAKLDLGALSFHYSRTSVADIVTECLTMVEQTAKARQISVRCDVEDLQTLPYIWTDPTRLRQVLLNLLTNAIKYNTAGGYARLMVSAEAGNVRFQVDDNGRGIAPEDINKLWAPFNRLGAENSDIEGSGIGLAFSRKIIEELEGEIGAVSELGKGSRFWFVLPLLLPETETAPQSASTSVHHINKAARYDNLKVLCVEDLEINQKIVRRMLMKLGITQLSFAYNCQSALEKLKDSRYNLILLDINLPDMDGFEFNRRKTAMGLAKETPVIALTASTSEETRKMATEYGIVGFVRKPIKFDRLSQSISEHAQPR